MLAAGFDAGVRYDERLEKDMIAVPIGPRRQRFVTAASPSYLLAHGEPRHPRDLLDHACIRHRFASGSVSSWEFERGDETIRISPRARVTANTLELEISAAIAGLGIIATFEEFLAPAIARGELVPILEDWTPDFPGPYLYYAGRKHMPPPLRAFVDFLKSRPRSRSLRSAASMFPKQSSRTLKCSRIVSVRIFRYRRCAGCVRVLYRLRADRQKRFVR